MRGHQHSEHASHVQMLHILYVLYTTFTFVWIYHVHTLPPGLYILWFNDLISNPHLIWQLVVQEFWFFKFIHCKLWLSDRSIKLVELLVLSWRRASVIVHHHTPKIVWSVVFNTPKSGKIRRKYKIHTCSTPGYLEKCFL